jgi:hypothetical protein
LTIDPCQLCETRKPKRYCLAVRGQICTQCCGTGRENTIDCPFECEYLVESRRHDKLVELTEEDYPSPDIELSEKFMYDLEPVIQYILAKTLDAVMETPGSVDGDVREAYEALVRTFKTMQSGLIYETRPANPYAGAIQQRVRASIEEFKQRIHEAQGMHTIRDSEILGCLVFAQRLALQYNNGRRRGKAFLHTLVDARMQYEAGQAAQGGQPPSIP